MVERTILLNPGPATTTETVKLSQVVPDICPREKDFGDIMHQIRKDLVTIAGGDDNYTSVLFAGSGTASMEATIGSVVPPGKKVLVINNGAYGKRLADIARTYGIDTVELIFDWGSKVVAKDVERALDDDKEIACVAMIHHETTTGILNPIEEVGRITKSKDRTFIVDTISSFAGIPFSIGDCHIDFMMSTSNKCIQGMAGVSFVICKIDELERVKDYPKRLYYLDLYSQYDHLETKKQTRFTPPVQVIYALKQAINEFFEEGVKERYNRYKKSYDVLINGLEQRGFKLFLGNEVQESHILTTIYEPEDENFIFDVFHDKLYDKGFTIYPGKVKDENTFRIAVMGDIDHEDIERFLIAVDEVLEDMDVRCN